jgi:glycosyltransferase involved in cell wall biosynthesis
MANAQAKLVVVTPVYEDREASTRLFRELASALGREAVVVAVDDGSVREPVEAGRIADAGLEGVVLRLRRNVGHQRAIAIGLGYTANELSPAEVVVMDSDGEDLPSSITALLARLRAGDADVAVAQRGNRVETLKFRAFYVVYKAIFSLLTGRRIAFGNFMAMNAAALSRLVSMQELWVHVAGCVLNSRLRVAACPLDRGPRYAGSSKMNFVALALHGFKALMVFAEDVLVRVGIVCAAVAVASVAGMLLAIGLKIAGFATPGWFSVALGIMMLMFLQTGTLTLVTLMLSGLMRSGPVAPSAWRDFVATVEPARPD